MREPVLSPLAASMLLLALYAVFTCVAFIVAYYIFGKVGWLPDWL
jgi:hypothetical protein